ncbi:alpha/beta hydrolase [Schumannella luteola]
MSRARRFARGVIRALVALVVVLVLLVVGVLFWANMVMRGERDAAIDAWTDPGVSIRSTDHSIVMTPTGEASGEGLVYIPGARVDPYAYMYVLSGAVTEGVTVVITKPTLNLAFFDQRPLDTFTADAPEVSSWAVGGHSLGGVRACQLADSPEVAGLVLFGSYCANDLSDSRMPVLSISGSADGLSTPEKIAEAAPLLPQSAVFVEIEGLNHAGFGSYGPQSGDGVGTVSRSEVRTELAELLREFFAR